MTLRIDHVVYAVRDLEEAAARWWDRYGLASVPGGRHPGWGTANRLVPFGEDYLELLCPVEPEVARATVLGDRLLELTREGDAWFSVCLADDDLEATAARLGLEVEPGSRTRPDGTQVRWRGAGIDAPGRDPWLPFFIAWDVPAAEHPGRTGAAHRTAVTGIAHADLEGDPARLRAWVGGEHPQLRVSPGDDPAVRSVTLRTPAGDLEVR